MFKRFGISRLVGSKQQQQTDQTVTESSVLAPVSTPAAPKTPAPPEVSSTSTAPSPPAPPAEIQRYDTIKTEEATEKQININPAPTNKDERDFTPPNGAKEQQEVPLEVDISSPGLMRQMEGPGSPQPYNTGYDSEENGEEKADVAFRREDTGSIKIEDEKAIETVRKEITGSSLRPRHSTDTFHLYIQTVSLQIPSLRDPSRNQYTPIDGPNSLENTGHKREHISRFRCLDERLIKIPITDLVEESDAGLFEKLYDEYYKTFAGGPNSWRRFFSFYGVEQVKIDLFRESRKIETRVGFSNASPWNPPSTGAISSSSPPSIDKNLITSFNKICKKKAQERGGLWFSSIKFRLRKLGVYKKLPSGGDLEEGGIASQQTRITHTTQMNTAYDPQASPPAPVNREILNQLLKHCDNGYGIKLIEGPLWRKNMLTTLMIILVGFSMGLWVLPLTDDIGWNIASGFLHVLGGFIMAYILCVLATNEPGTFKRWMKNVWAGLWTILTFGWVSGVMYGLWLWVCSGVFRLWLLGFSRRRGDSW